MRLVFASHNAHKLDEVRRIMGNIVPSVTLSPPNNPAPVEDGDSFIANALIKARAQHTTPDQITLADDSGIVVDALGGEPGIHSARYSGTGDDRANLDLLLTNLGDNPNRVARFVCAGVAIIGDTEHTVERSWWGTIAHEPSGAAGFGYDPIFIPTGFTTTVAQMSSRDKDILSHRGQAFRHLALLIRPHLT
jgi:XTP/dITP diphosphohydrolase